jgi:hypothetical protein
MMILSMFGLVKYLVASVDASLSFANFLLESVRKASKSCNRRRPSGPISLLVGAVPPFVTLPVFCDGTAPPFVALPGFCGDGAALLPLVGPTDFLLFIKLSMLMPSAPQCANTEQFLFNFLGLECETLLCSFFRSRTYNTFRNTHKRHNAPSGAGPRCAKSVHPWDPTLNLKSPLPPHSAQAGLASEPGLIRLSHLHRLA